MVWLGDSMTQATQVPLEERFVELLEKETGHPHYNLAVGGTSVDYAASVITRYYDIFKPDLVVLGFFPENDYAEFGKGYPECDFGPIYSRVNGGFLHRCKGEKILVLTKNEFTDHPLGSKPFGRITDFDFMITPKFQKKLDHKKDYEREFDTYRDLFEPIIVNWNYEILKLLT